MEDFRLETRNLPPVIDLSASATEGLAAETRRSISGDTQLEPMLSDTDEATICPYKEESTKRFRSFRFPEIQKWCQDSWILEYLALALSVACLVAIFIVLLCYSNKTLDTWHSYLGINTVLSILATALKGATLLAAASALGQLKWAWYSLSPRSLGHFQTFDSASRGPFGAMVLLWRQPWSPLACIGSVIMIIALGSDAAIQASTSQPIRPQHSETASVPVARVYDSLFPSGELDPLLASAMYTGILGSKTTTDRKTAYWPIGYVGKPNTIHPVCDSGNCTFQPYASLAIKHQCSNITHLLQHSYDNKTGIQYAKLSASSTFLPATLPDKKVLQSDTLNLSCQIQHDSPHSVSNITILDMACSRPWFANSRRDQVVEAQNNGYVFERLPVLEVYMVVINPYRTNFEAFRCNLDFGMQIHSASVDKGQFTENPLGFIQGNWTFDPGNNPFTENMVADEANWVLNTTLFNNKGDMVKVKYFSWTSIIHHIPEYFTGTRGDVGQTTDDLFMTIYTARHWDMDINTIFQAIAESLTNYFRTASGQFAVGLAESQEQYVQVVWPWLIVPIVLVGLNAIFVVAVYLQSRRLKLPNWRNNALAFMLNEKTIYEDKVGGGVRRDDILIGPPHSIKGVSELEMWAEGRSAVLRGRLRGINMTWIAMNDSLEELGEEEG